MSAGVEEEVVASVEVVRARTAHRVRRRRPTDPHPVLNEDGADSAYDPRHMDRLENLVVALRLDVVEVLTMDLRHPAEAVVKVAAPDLAVGFKVRISLPRQSKGTNLVAVEDGRLVLGLGLLRLPVAAVVEVHVHRVQR